jgi:hypothetical protein
MNRDRGQTVHLPNLGFQKVTGGVGAAQVVMPENQGEFRKTISAASA